MATWEASRKEETTKSVGFMRQTGGLRQQTHKIIQIVRKGACWLSKGEALSSTSAEVQRKIQQASK